MSEPQVISGGSLRPYPTDCTESEAEPLKERLSLKDLASKTLASKTLATPYHRIKALPQVIPAPIAIIAIRSPGSRRPARLASSSEIGSEALDVLP